VIKHLIYGWLAAAIAAKTEAEKTGEADPIEARMLRFPGGRGEAPDPLKPDPGALPASYYKGLVCEYFDLDAQKWITPRGVRNEPLDTLGYAYWAALAPAIKIDVIREAQWAALEAQLGPAPVDLFSLPNDSRETSSGPTPVVPNAVPKAPRRGGVVDGDWSIG
jgi:phage terminase large subunit GpA-like protein